MTTQYIKAKLTVKQARQLYEYATRQVVPVSDTESLVFRDHVLPHLNMTLNDVIITSVRCTGCLAAPTVFDTFNEATVEIEYLTETR